jgi:hypothetical protein
MNSENNIYSISVEKKEIIIEKNTNFVQKNDNMKMDELIKNVNKLSKKYDFFNRQISKNSTDFNDRLNNLLDNVKSFSNDIDKEIIQNGNINSKKHDILEYI